jgi:DNA-binding LacI/PurR family transcriptional regulator
MVGRMLQGGASKTIGILECQRSVVIFSELMQLVCRELRKRGYQTYYRIWDNDSNSNEQEQEAVNDFISRRVDGVIIAYFDKQRSFPRCKCPVPLTVFGGGDWDVRIDLEQCAYQTAKHLLNHGHRRIGYLLPDDKCNEDKLQGYRKALKEFGIEPDPSWLIKVCPTPDWQNEIERGICEGRLTAICCSNDFYAVRLMTWLQWRGYNIPEDIAITGFDGVALVDSLQIPLTTVVQPVELLAESLADAMINKIEKQTMTRLPEPIQLQGKLHIGHSCGCAATAEPEIDWHSVKINL